MGQKIYTDPETAITFATSGGTVTITLTSLANAAGRLSAQWDRGAGAQPAWYRWQARFRANVAPAIGAILAVYLVTGDDGTYLDGDFGTADAAISALTDLANARMLGVVVADAASTTKDFVASGLCLIRSRYVSVAVWNALGQALNATAGDHEVRLTPVPDEIQAAI